MGYYTLLTGCQVLLLEETNQITLKSVRTTLYYMSNLEISVDFGPENM